MSRALLRYASTLVGLARAYANVGLVRVRMLAWGMRAEDDREDDIRGAWALLLLTLSGAALCGAAYVVENYEAGWAVRVLAWLLLAEPK
jgi:hypothetical protein